MTLPQAVGPADASDMQLAQRSSSDKVGHSVLRLSWSSPPEIEIAEGLSDENLLAM